MSTKQQIETGTKVKFIAYKGGVEDPVLAPGEEVFITGFATDGSGYNVARKQGGKAIETILASEFEVIGAKPSVVAKKAAKKAAKEKPEPAAKKATKKTAAKKAAKEKAPKKAAKVKPEPEPLPPVKLDRDAKAEIEAAGGSLVKAAKTLAVRAETADYTLGSVLAKILEEKAHEKVKDPATGEFYSGAKGFGDFAENYVGIAYRKALYLMEIYRTCERFGIKPQEVAKIGWSKFKEALRAFTADNVEEILTQARELPFGAFQQAMRSRIIDAGNQHGNGKKTKMTSFKFILHNDKTAAFREAVASAATNLELAVTDVAKMNGEQLGQCVDYIVGQYLQG